MSRLKMTHLRPSGPSLLRGLSWLWRDDGGEEQGLSAPEFRERATALCEKYWSQITALGQPESLEELRTFLDESLPIVEEANGSFHDLSPPDELAEDWDEFTEIDDENLEKSRDLQEAVAENDGSRARTLYNDLGSLNADLVRSARTLGLEECVGPPP